MASLSHSGDNGTTGLLGEKRVPKFHLIIETLGTLDEASAALGMARALSHSPNTITSVKEIQRDLYTLMAEVSATQDSRRKVKPFDPLRLKWLEELIGILETKVSIPHEFILPGDSIPGAAFSLARTIVRRAERRVAELASHGQIELDVILPYLNRLSMYCFLQEIAENQAADQETSLVKNKRRTPSR